MSFLTSLEKVSLEDLVGFIYLDGAPIVFLDQSNNENQTQSQTDRSQQAKKRCGYNGGPFL
jgi:hypothetical protein